MKSGDEFIKRMQEDAEFRRKVNACPSGAERLAFLKSQGYDFSPFIRILNNLSTGKQSHRLVGAARRQCQPRAGRFRFFGAHQPNIPCRESRPPEPLARFTGGGASQAFGWRIFLKGGRQGQLGGPHDPGFRPARPGP